MIDPNSSDSIYCVSIRSLMEMQCLATAMSSVVRTPICIGLDGTLGAGKTQWTRFFAESLGANPRDVTSPTFVLVHRYETIPRIYHLDAYRLADEDEFYELGVEEMFQEDSISIIEWSKRVEDSLPDERWMVFIEVVSEEARSVTIEAIGPRSIQSLHLLRCQWTSLMETNLHTSDRIEKQRDHGEAS